MIEVRVPEQYRSSLFVGEGARGEIDGEVVTLVVEQIAPSADSLSKTVLVKFSLVDDSKIALGSSMKVYADID